MSPNILYLHSHDTGRYISPYGHAVATPCLHRLAEQGVLFRQHFCVGPTCSPSRAALLTGCYPHENGMLGLAHRGFRLNDYNLHIIHTLHAAGYASALAGVQHIAAPSDGRQPWQIIGYHEYLEGPAHECAAKFFRRPPKEPFFLSVGFFETHREFPPPNELRDNPNYCLPPAPLPDAPQTRLDMARFKASARALDEKMGFVLDALERCGLAERTLVVCTTDHGIAFPRMKCTLHDSGIGVMLIMRGPGGFDGGKAVDAMTGHMDIFPTVCELLRIPPPPWLRGKSLLPLLRGEREELHDALFFEVNFHAACEPMRAVRTRRWKYIRRFDNRKKPVLPNCDDGESKTLWLANGWADMPPAQESLFDLMFDPNETCNLAEKPEFGAALAEMRERTLCWMRETNDPLLRGELRPPAGAVVNDPDGVSPRDPCLEAAVFKYGAAGPDAGT